MKKTFLRRLTSIIVALSMISISVSTGTFAVETGPDTAEAAGTSAVNNDVETDLESGGGNYSQSENNVEGGSSDGTGEPSETSAPAETSVTEPPADTEVTTATGETSAETTAPAEDTYGDTSNADETDMNTQETSETDETEETEQDEIDLLELEQHVHDDIVFEPLNSENIYSGSYYLAADNVEIKDIDGKVDLCLNGKSIKHSGLFYIEANTVLNIYDDYAPGENVQIYIDGIYMGLGGADQTINIHGGYVNLSSDVDSPCIINVYDGKFDSNYSIGLGTLNIYGGEINFPNLDISNSDGTLTLSGNPKMDGTTITTKTDNPIKITGQLGADVKCKVQLGEFGKYDGTGLFAELSDESYASESNFISPEGYTVVKVGTKLYLTDHLHEDGTAFFPWTETDSLPTESGSYYLSNDVHSAYSGLYLDVKDTTINLCLNGHNIDALRLQNATLNIYDETGAGKISGIVCNGGAVLNIYGGTLEDSGISLNLQNRTNNPNVVHIYGGTINSGEVSAINIEGSSDKVEISGGTINCGTKNGGINVNKGTLTISGEPTISGNYSGVYGAVCFGNDNSFYLSGSPTINGKNGSQALRARGNNIININGKLTPKEPITIALPYEPKEETYLFAVMEDESYADASAFAAYDEGYTIVKNGKKLYLTKQQEPHEHDGKAFTPWLDTESLPTTSGSYYLTKDVHINSARYTISSDIDLCLHGHSISFDLEYGSAWLYIDDGSNFNLYDDENKGKVEGTLWINRGGNAIIYGGTFDYYIAVGEGGKAVIKGGMFSKGCQLYGGDLTIDGGTIETQGVAIQLINDSSFLTINNGIIKSKGSLVIDSAALNPDNAAITINGGTITGETQNTPVIAVSDGNKLTITGGTISGSRSISSISKDFYLSGNAVIDGNIIIAVYPINIIGELTNTDPYVIYMQTPGVFATGEFAAQSADKFTPSAELASEGYTVVVTENNELAIDYRHYTYGDNGEFKLLQMKPPRPTSLDSGIAVISLPENCDLKVNGKTVTDATVIEESTNYKYIISVKISRENGFNIGENKIQGLISSNEEQTNVNDSGSYSIKVIVDPKPISAEFADDPAKTYDGNTECEAEFTSDGILKGDDVSITAERCEFDSANVGTREVTAYGLTITGDQKDFYKLEEDEIIGSGKITPKPLDIPESEFTYNGETVLEVELDGENGEKVTATLTAYSKNAGTYTYNINAADGFYTAELSSANYSIDTAGALTINKLTAEIKWQDETTFVYDGEAKIVKATLSNKVANDDVKFEFKGNVGTKAGTYTAEVIGFIGADKGNYTLENAENTEQSWKITAADSGLTLTAENKTVTYGGNVSLTVTINRTSTNGIMTMSAAPDKVDFYIGDDLIGTESVTYTNGSNGTAVLELPATSAKHFKAGENTIRAEYGGSGDLLASSGEIVIKVEPKPVTADIIGVTSKTYDGTNIITDLSLQLDGIESCDAENVKATAESYTFNSANVNEASTITANGAVLFGTQAENYKLTVNTAQGEITPAKVDIPKSEFTYDGETVRKVEIDGVNGEKVTATLTAYSKNAGTYTYNINAADGFYTAELSSANYSIDTAGALTINKLTAEIKWQDETTFVYDGEAKIVKATLSNKVANDDVKFEFKGNVGTKAGTYTAEVIGFIGADKGNYTLENAENTEQSWKITAADSGLTLTAENKTVTYGGNVSLTVTINRTSTNGIMTMSAAPDKVDFYIGDDLIGTESVTYTNGSNGTAVLELPATSAKHFKAGENTIRAEYGGSGDLLASSGEIVIKVEPKPVTADIVGVTSKTYDGTNVITELSLKLDGIESCDAENVEATAESYTFNSADVETANTITANGAALFGTQAENYKLTVNTAQGEITPAKVDIPESEFTYNGETVLEVELDGENGEKVTATLTAYSKNAGTYTYDVTPSTGKYTAELSSANYSIDKAGALTIDPRVAEIEWQDETTFVYDGEAKIVKATLSNKVANDDVKFEFKGNVGTKAGTYTAEVIGFIGADKGNYTLENAENTEQSWKITAADSGLTLTAENKTVTYGGNVSLTVTINRTSTNGIMTMSAAPDKVDFYIGDDLIGTESVTYTNGSNGTAVLELPATSAKHFKAGENTIRAEYGGSGDLLASSGEIVIKVEPKPVTADIIGVTSKTYDGTNIITDLSLQLDGIESCDAENVKATAESYTFNSANVNEASTITANGAVLFGTQAENYKLTVNTAQGEITPAKVDIPESEFTYDGETVRKVEIDGVNNETVTATLTAYSKNAGTYAYDVTPSAGKYTAELSSTNYSIDTAGALTIDPRVAEIEWQDEISFDYDGTEKSVAAEVTNTVSGDALNIAYKNNKATDVGEYTAEIISLGDDNYTLDGAENVTLAWEISAVGREETNVAIDYIGETLSTSDDMEYSTDGETWLPCAENMSVKAVGWNESESLTVKFRYAADKNHTAGKTQNVTIPPRPAAPDISEVTVTKTQDSITVTEIANCEYSIDGKTWQDSGTFDGLTEGTEYTVQIRTKADESKFASFAAEKTVVTSDTSSGTTDLKEGETVETDSGSITNDGKNVEIEDNDGNKTTVTLPDGASDSVEVDESGNVKVPDGSVVETGDTTVTLPDGGTVSPDGTITADKVVIGDTTVSGDEVTVTPDGNITVSENGTVQSGDTTLELPDGGTVSPDGTITADKVVVGDKTVSGDEVTVTSDGNITVSENGTVQSGDTTVELPDGGTISPDGTITADKVVIGDTTVSGDEVTVTPDGNITVSENGTVQNGDTTLTLPDGGTVNPDGTITADKVVIGDTTVSGDEVTVTPDGDIIVSANGTVQSGDTTVELPDGGTVNPDGTITADKVVIDDTTVSGDEVTVTPDGNITVSENGTVQNGDTTVTLPDGGTVSPDGTITADNVVIGDTTVSGDEVTVTPDGDITVSGNGKVQDEDTIVTGETVTVDKDGNIAIPNGGTVSANGSETVIGNDGSIKNNEVSIEPVDSVGYCDENGENYSLSNGYIVLDIESADDDEIVKDLESESDISVIKAYDIKLLYNGKFEVQPNGTVKVTIAAPTGVDGTEKVLHINENGFEDMNAEYDRNSNTFSFKTDHFSIYVIAASDDDPIVPPPTSSGSTQTHPIEPEETTGSEETTSPEETTVPEETTAPEETTVPEETTAPEETTSSEETTVPEETAKPEETTDYPTDVSGDNSENNPPTGVSPDLAVLATAAFTVAAALFLKKKRSSDK